MRQKGCADLKFKQFVELFAVAILLITAACATQGDRTSESGAGMNAVANTSTAASTETDTEVVAPAKGSSDQLVC